MRSSCSRVDEALTEIYPVCDEQSGPALAANSQDLYESLLSRCKEYISNREEESNPRGIESAHGTSWLVRRLRLDLLWEPENEEEQTAFCAAFDPLTLYWKALEQLRADAASAPPAPEQDDMKDGADDSTSYGVTVPGVLSSQEVVSPSRWKLVEPHSLTASLSIQPANVRATSICSQALSGRAMTDGLCGRAIISSMSAVSRHTRLCFVCSRRTPARQAQRLRTSRWRRTSY